MSTDQTKLITQSYQNLRYLTEKVRYLKKGKWYTALQKPADCEQWEHVEFSMRAITSNGEKMDGDRVICIGVDTHGRKRKVKFMESGEIRWVYDMFIKQINNAIIVMH